MNKFSKILSNLIFIFIIFLSGCSEDNTSNSSTNQNLITISIFTDPHLYDQSLGTSSDAFKQYLAGDRKMIAESEAILKSIVNMISNDNSKVVIVSGDLTKDGEKQSHQLFASYLKQLEDKGKKVYVIPGNHDVDNPASYSYPANSSPVKVPTVTAEEFKTIYAEYGYKEAISTDPNGSLSYIVEPVDGVWLFCMDACRWRENSGKSHSVTGGVFTDATFNWIKQKLNEGKQKNKLMIGTVHHNIAEHFNGQKLLFTDYIIDNWENVSKTFAELGMNVVFTGHHHAHDARKYTSGSNFVVDIQTSSSVTWPSAIRRVTIDKNWVMKVTSEKITNIQYDTKGANFQDYAKNYLSSGMPLIIQAYLKQMGLPDAAIQVLAPVVLDVYLAYTHGNEDQFYTTEKKAALDQVKAILGSNAQLAPLLMILEGMYKDLEPNDYEFTINLKTGAVSN